MYQSAQQTLITLYLEYVNDFVTVLRFANHHGISKEDAQKIIDMGKAYHEENVANLKISLIQKNNS